MTRDEILNMPAGSKIDTLIAEKLNLFRSAHDAMLGDLFYGYVGEHPGVKPLYIGSYSSDIEAAWEVVEKFENRCMLNNVHGIWECYLPDGATGKAETAPLAICRAALLATLE